MQDYDIHQTQGSVPVLKIDVQIIVSSREIPAGYPADTARHRMGCTISQMIL